MIKILTFLLLLSSSNSTFAQDSLQLFYINRVTLTATDSSSVAACKKTEYKSVSLEINLFRNNGPTETIYATGSNYQWWKDSVLFSYNIPASLYHPGDSMVLHPTFHIACEGLDGNRGTESVEAEGKSNAVKNIAVKFVSNPPGASVFLIPKLIWERNPGLNSKTKNEMQLGRYAVYNGVTPVQSTAQEYVYIALFKYNNTYVPVECSPTHFNSDDTVYAKFPQ